MKHTTSRRFLFCMIVGGAALALTGSQCTQVGDRLTGPNSLGGDVSGQQGTVAQCVQTCNDIAKAARSSELDLHKNNIIACQELTGAEKDECLAEEDARHEAAMEQIASDQQACKAPCHEQGTGSGGQ